MRHWIRRFEENAHCDMNEENAVYTNSVTVTFR